MKVTIKGWLTCAPAYKGGMDFGFFPFKPTPGSSLGVAVREQEFEVDVPDDYDPRMDIVADLEAQKKALRAQFAGRVKEIDDRIASLLAIENNSTVTA